MGFLKIFSKPRGSGAAGVQRLPSGSVTVDRHGHMVTTTVSSTYPQNLLLEIARDVLRLFREAHAAQLPVTELHIHFASLQITAREMRGGAIIFLSPLVQFTSPPLT